MPTTGRSWSSGSSRPRRPPASTTSSGWCSSPRSRGSTSSRCRTTPTRTKYLDTWTLLSVLGARTSTITLAPNVASLPLRPPVVLAKAAATLDLVTGGRVELGLGAGAFWDAIVAAGGPRRTPGEAVDALAEAVRLIQAFWAGGTRALRGRALPGGRAARRAAARARHPGLARRLQAADAAADRAGWPTAGCRAWATPTRRRSPTLSAALDEAAVARRPRARRRSGGSTTSSAGSAPAAASCRGRPRRLGRAAGRAHPRRRHEHLRPRHRRPRRRTPLRDRGRARPCASWSTRSGRGPPGPPTRPPTRPRAVSRPRPRSRTVAGAPPAGESRRARGDRAPSGVTPTPDDGTRLVRRAAVGRVRPADATTARHRGRRTPASGPAQHLVDIHDGLRAELTSRCATCSTRSRAGHLTVGAARSVVNTMTMRQNNWTLGAYCESYCRIVTGHHTLEDRSVFPHLRRSEPGLGPVLDRLEARARRHPRRARAVRPGAGALVGDDGTGQAGERALDDVQHVDRPAHRHPALAPGLRGARADRSARAARLQLTTGVSPRRAAGVRARGRPRGPRRRPPRGTGRAAAPAPRRTTRRCSCCP